MCSVAPRSISPPLKQFVAFTNPEPRIREKTVHRLRQRLNEFEQAAPRPVKAMIADLINRLDAEERVASEMRLGR